MKFESINKKYTEAVAAWMAKGFIINTATMGGSQGEVAHVDLTDGKEIIRVLLGNICVPCERIENRFYHLDGLSLIVGRVTDQITPNSPNTWQTLWNNHLEIVSEERFYEIGRQHRDGSKWYGTKEEAIAQQDKNAARYRARFMHNHYTLSESAKAIVLPFVKRQPKCRSVKLSEIEAVTHHDITSRTGKRYGQYTVKVRGNSFQVK